MVNNVDDYITMEELRKINYYDFVKSYDSSIATDNEKAYYREARTWYNYNITKDELEEIKNKKNDECEISISDKELTKDELLEKFLPTVVSLRLNFTTIDHQVHNLGFGGNIYDITDDAIYIITCSHSFDSTWMGYEELKEYNYMQIMFIDGTKIEVNSECFYIPKGNDLALIKINKELLEQETLDIIKSINIDNMYLMSFSNSLTYTVRYSDDVSSYNVYDYTCDEVEDWGYHNKILNGHGSLVNGCSGMGLFDMHGNYIGYCENGILVRYFTIFPDFYTLLLESGY